MENNKSVALDKKSTLAQMIPVMLCFFAMGFVDLVGTASNYVQKDLDLTDSQANLFPSLVFFWFLIFSVPTGLLMNLIGRKKTVLLSLVITAASLLVPVLGDTYIIMLLSFSLLGIGNAVMQTSLNPLVTNLSLPRPLPSVSSSRQSPPSWLRSSPPGARPRSCLLSGCPGASSSLSTPPSVCSR